MDIIWLIFAHFVGDFSLQTSFMAQTKGKLWYVMLAHSIVWTACIAAMLQSMGMFATWKVAFLIVGHFMCDKWKCMASIPPANEDPPKDRWHLVYYDQVFHMMQLVIVYMF